MKNNHQCRNCLFKFATANQPPRSPLQERRFSSPQNASSDTSEVEKCPKIEGMMIGTETERVFWRCDENSVNQLKWTIENHHFVLKKLTGETRCTTTHQNSIISLLFEVKNTISEHGNFRGVRRDKKKTSFWFGMFGPQMTQATWWTKRGAEEFSWSMKFLTEMIKREEDVTLPDEREDDKMFHVQNHHLQWKVSQVHFSPMKKDHFRGQTMANQFCGPKRTSWSPDLKKENPRLHFHDCWVQEMHVVRIFS